MEHTPTPLEAHYDPNNQQWDIITQKPYQRLFSIPSRSTVRRGKSDQDETLARSIVQAVNSHDELVAALTDLDHLHWSGEPPAGLTRDQVLRNTRTALSNATKEG